MEGARQGLHRTRICKPLPVPAAVTVTVTVEPRHRDGDNGGASGYFEYSDMEPDLPEGGGAEAVAFDNAAAAIKKVISSKQSSEAHPLVSVFRPGRWRQRLPLNGPEGDL